MNLNHEHIKQLGLDGKIEVFWPKQGEEYENIGLWKKLVPVGNPSQILISSYNPSYDFVGRDPRCFKSIIKSKEYKEFGGVLKRAGKIIDVELRNIPEYFTHYCRGYPYYLHIKEFEIGYEVIPVSFFVGIDTFDPFSLFNFPTDKEP